MSLEDLVPAIKDFYARAKVTAKDHEWPHIFLLNNQPSHHPHLCLHILVLWAVQNQAN